MATINSNGTGGGAWSATGSWSGGVVPVLGDKVNILSGDTITVDDTSRAGGDDTSTAINVSGVLKASRTANSTLRCRGEVNIDNGGELDYGKSADKIPIAYTATLQLNDSATLADGKWGLTADNGAKFYVYGSATRTTNTYLTTQLAASGTSFDVNDATGWAIGDKLIIATTAAGNTAGETEERTISNVVGSTITISAATYLHEIGGRVGNFTKNVVFEAYNSSYASYTDLNSSDALNNADDREIQHLEMRYMGDNAAQTKYGALRFIMGLGTEVIYTSVGNVTFYEGENVFHQILSLSRVINHHYCAML